MQSIDVLGLGMATIDILTTVPRLPKSNEVYEVIGLHIEGGGPVSTALVALSKLGSVPAYLGTVAADIWGKMILQEFDRYNVCIEHVIRGVEGESPVSVILIEKDTGQRAILYRKSSLPELKPSDLSSALIASAKILHLDGVHLSAAIQGAHIARANQVLVSLDGGAGESWSGLDELLPLIDILVVARQFAARVTGLDDPTSAGPVLLKFGASEVVITDGENGCWYWDKSHHFHQPAFHVNIVDTTGAGDTFHGAYLFARLQGSQPKKRLIFASAVAALKCTHIGGRSGIPDRQETEKFIMDQYGSF